MQKIRQSFSKLKYFAFASTTDIGSQLHREGFEGVFADNIGTYVSRGLELAMIIAVIGALVMIIWGGVAWISSEGDKTKYEEARKKITSGFIGLILVAAAWAIWMIALQFLGLDKLDRLQLDSNRSTGTESVYHSKAYTNCINNCRKETCENSSQSDEISMCIRNTCPKICEKYL